jgi:hypothetical protein
MELTIASPAHLISELKEIADTLEVSVEALCAYFFANEVVHT